MESRIRILPAALADQIAAGEVVERPASVVKELVENALDAGAGRIEIDITTGGRELIRVVDDGSGMNPDEAHLALRRHATSKLQSFDQLSDLRTMGFRGEALPSIAAVSRLTLTTRPRDSIEGYRLLVEGGIESEAGGRPAGAPRGTQVEVRDLFWNVPARLKFLKAEATETAHVTDTVVRLALAHPEIHFRLRVFPKSVHEVGGGEKKTRRGGAILDGGRGATVLDLPPHRSVLERATAALGRRGAVHLELAEGSESGIRVTACLGAPAESTNTTRNTYLFVNRRTLRDRGLLHALAMGYGELLERGRHPLAAVYIEMSAGTVDVNVHPQKTEVRFIRPQDVMAAVRHVVRAACARAPWLGEPAGVRVYHLPPSPSYPARERRFDDARMSEALGLFAPRAGSTPPTTMPDTGATGATGATDATPGPFEHPTLDGGAPREVYGAPFGRSPSDGDDGAPIRLTNRPLAPLEAVLRRPFEGSSSRPTEAGSPSRSEPGGFFASLRYLGQVQRTYLVCEAQGELVLIDQHAAHERVAFERLKLAHGEKTVRTQRLLFPLVLDLDETQAAAVHDQGEVLSGLGFEIEPLYGRSFVVKAVPEALGDIALDSLVKDILDELASRGASDVMAARLDHLFATMACHSVVRAGDVLDEVRVRALLDSMDGIDFRAHCPHGRPVLLRMAIGELERRFGRS